MPRCQTRFQPSWLDKTDISGHRLEQWCRADDSSPHKAYCIVCQKSIMCGNNGLKQVLSHAEGKKHIDTARAKFGKSQKHFATCPEKKTSTEQGSSGTCGLQPSLLEKVATAEILWTLKVAQSNYSYSSCDGTPELFRKMFPGDTSQNFTMSRTKVSYLLSDGLGPYYRREMCNSIRETKVPYTIQYDETGNSQNRKQCDILIRYWSPELDQICVRFLKALMFGHAPGKKVAQAILDTLLEDGYQLPLSQLISLGSDGPNVNKTIWNKINEHMKEAGLSGMLPFIPCNLHVIHNAFRQGLNMFGEDAEQLVLDLFYYLKASPCRKEDFFDTQLGLGLDEETFIRHVQSRWLTLIPAVRRVIDRLEAVKQYFFKDLPKAAKESKTEKSLESNERYRRICRKLKDPGVIVQLYFLQNLDEVFSNFLTLFQKEEPLIHILHDQLSQIVRTLMLRFLKANAVGDKIGKKLLSVDISKQDNQLPDKMLVIGESTKEALKKVKAEQQKIPLLQMRQFYQSATLYMVKKLPLGREILKDLESLHPLKQKTEQGVLAIERTAKKMPQVIADDELSLLTDEWKLYRAQDIPETWYQDPSTKEYLRIDNYWNKVLAQKNSLGAPQYKVLPKFVKAALCLAHGNAEVERSLSENKRAITSERTLLSDESINALRTTKDAIRVVGHGQVHDMPITPSLMQARKTAYRVYNTRMKEAKEKEVKERQMKEQKEKDAKDRQDAVKSLEERKRKLEDREKLVKEAEKKCQEELKVAEDLYGEVNRRLQNAIKDKNMTEIGIVQSLSEVASKKMETARRNLEKNRTERDQLDGKRQRMMASYSQKLNDML